MQFEFKNGYKYNVEISAFGKTCTHRIDLIITDEYCELIAIANVRTKDNARGNGYTITPRTITFVQNDYITCTHVMEILKRLESEKFKRC